MLSSAVLLASALLSATASPLKRQQALNTTTAIWDGSCFYPPPDDTFELNTYLGRWYQVAGTVAPFTAGCKCIYAEYSLNANGTVDVRNGCEAAGRQVNIQGTAMSVSQQGYGTGGLLRVQFPGQPGPECPGPNYIVQDIEQGGGDGSWAIVQASNFSTLFLLSREQHPGQVQISKWLDRAGQLGSDLSKVVVTDQTACQFT